MGLQIHHEMHQREDTNTKVDKGSELSTIESDYQSLSIHNTEAGDIILNNDSEIFIPSNYRQEMRSLLHSTHLSDAGMILLAKNKFFWPKMRTDLKNLYKSCEECLVNSASKPHPSYEVNPSPLELLSPNECIYMDYLTFCKQDVLVFRDKMSGFIWARITKDKSIASSTDALDNYIHTFDRPITIVSDGGPAFNHGFVDFVRARHINHRYTSAYRPQSNSPAERAVKSLKDVLEKLSKLDIRTLREVVFNVNNHVSQNDSGSNAERFFLRGIRSNLPNSFRRNLNVDDLIRIRSDKRQKAAEKMGRRSADEFEVGQVVRVQDTVNKHWKKKGEIIEARTTDDGQHDSFRVRMEN